MYLIATILLALIFITKYIFVFVGKGSPYGIQDLVSLGMLMGIIIVGFISYLRSPKRQISNTKSKPANKIVVVVSICVIALSMFITITKKTVLWDAVALYDARAVLLSHGVGFTQMVELSKYDPQNSYYYVLYPPHTSILHFLWYSLNVPVPAAFIYSVYLAIFALTIFIFARHRLGANWAMMLTVLTVSNNVVFSSSVSEYTNLPFTLQMFLGVILLYDYLEDKQKWKALYGIGLIVTTAWIRFLEPIWLASGLAFLIASFIKNRWSKNLICPILLLLYGVWEYFYWQTFVSGFGNATKIVNFSAISFLEPVLGFLTGSAVNLLFFFVKSWGGILFVYLFTVFLPFVNKKKINFFQLFIVFTIAVYYAGLYFVSFQSVWWKALGDSLVRSSAFMIPIAGYIILEYIHGKKN